jgi:hypothetical protein
MLHKMMTAIGTMLTLLLLIWVVANAGVGMKAPDIASQTWLNSTPLHLADLKGKVVMVEFWTFGCYNCRNVEPMTSDFLFPSTTILRPGTGMGIAIGRRCI